MRISDWSSDVCSSDLVREAEGSLCEGALLETLSHLGGRAELARRARIGAGGHRRDDLPRTHHAARRYRAGCGLMEGAPTAAEPFAAVRVLVAIDDERGRVDREAPEGDQRSEQLERGLDRICPGRGE